MLLILWYGVAARSFFQRFSVFLIFFDQTFFDFYFLGSFLYFTELIVAKNYNIFFPRLRPRSLSAETLRLSAEMKIPSAEMEKSRASALKARVTKRGRSRMMLTSILYDFCYDSSLKNYSNEYNSGHFEPSWAVAPSEGDICLRSIVTR